MVQGGFPGSALVTQLFRQFTKPLSKRIVVYAARHPTFRRYFLVAPGRFHHRLEENLRRLKGSTPTDGAKAPGTPIKDEQAVEIGSQLMIEIVIFGLLVILLMCDWTRSQRRAEAREASQRREFEELEERKAEARARLEALELETDLLRAELARLGGWPDGRQLRPDAD